MDISIGFILPVDSPAAAINCPVRIDSQVRGAAFPGKITAGPGIFSKMKGIYFF
jgi:hypothetical protein